MSWSGWCWFPPAQPPALGRALVFLWGASPLPSLALSGGLPPPRMQLWPEHWDLASGSLISHPPATETGSHTGNRPLAGQGQGALGLWLGW